MKRSLLFSLFLAAGAILWMTPALAAPATCQPLAALLSVDAEAQMSPAGEVETAFLPQPELKLNTCRQECFSFYWACRQACGGDEACLSDCSDQLEYCWCGACGYCP